LDVINNMTFLSVLKNHDMISYCEVFGLEAVNNFGNYIHHNGVFTGIVTIFVDFCEFSCKNGGEILH